MLLLGFLAWVAIRGSQQGYDSGLRVHCGMESGSVVIRGYTCIVVRVSI